MSDQTCRIFYIIPVHNEESIVAQTVARVFSWFSHFKLTDSQILLIENGSSDQSFAVCNSQAQADKRVHAYHEAGAGIGYAYHRGLVEGLKVVEAQDRTQTWFLLSACDLPFGRTDLEGFFKFRGAATQFVFVGSKAHPESQIPGRGMRSVMSAVFYLLRRIILGMKVKDSQGTVLLRADLAQKLVPQIHSRNFFFSTELLFWAQKLGVNISELPVVLEPELRPSTVRPMKHSLQMLKQALDLRKTSGHAGGSN